VSPGRYLQIEVLMQRSSNGESPTLYDLSVGTLGYAPPMAANEPPTVFAGQDQDIEWPAAAALSGSICDDALPFGAARTAHWSKVSGPGTVTFTAENAIESGATFSEPGLYILRFDASDSQFADFSTLRVTALPVNSAPQVSAGPDLSVSKSGDAVALHGWSSDDGLPSNNRLVSSWSALGSPAGVTFLDPASPDTSATFAQPGIYVLQLSATDSLLTSRDLVEVRVASPCEVEAPSGLVAWWSGNGHLHDSIGGHHGTAVGALTFTPSKVSFGMEFDGGSGMFQVPAAPELNVGAGNGFTLEFWIRPDALNYWQPLIEWNGGGAAKRGTHLYIEYTYGGGRLYANLIDTNGVGHNVYSAPGLLKLGEFQHIAFTYDKALGLVRFFRNGEIFQEIAMGTFSPQTTYDIYVGHTPLPGESYFNGNLDEISLYNRPLISEIMEIYRAGIVGKCPTGANEHPVVDAGPDQQVAETSGIATLNGFISDDGLPAGAPLTSQWSLLHGPGTVNFADPSSAVTGATFSAPGIYLLQLTAYDTASRESDIVEVRVATPCLVDADPSLVAWWPGNGNGRELVAGNDGELISGTTFGNGKASQGFEFDGVNDYIKVPKEARLDIGASSGMTIEFWIKPDALNRWQPLFEWDSDTARGAHLYIEYTYGGGRLYANLIDINGVGHNVYSAPGLLKLGEFQHIAMTYDKTTGVLRFYRNGEIFQEVALGVFTPQTSYDFYIASSVRDRSNYFDGILDEVSLYNRVLVSELNAIYRAGATGKCPVDANEHPRVDAGPDRSVHAIGTAVSLNGKVEDDGVPVDSQLTSRWTLASGPGTVTFANLNAAVTTASFSAPGIYVLKLTGNDGASEASDTIEVRVALSSPLAPPDGLVAWWPGNGNAQEMVAGNDGELISGTTFGSGKVSQGFEFDGLNDYIKAPKDALLHIGASAGMTIAFWIKPDALNRWQSIIEWDSATARGTHLFIEYTYGGGRLYANLLDINGTGHEFYSAPGLLKTGEFQHIALTYDKATGLCRLYRNGEMFQEVALGSFTPQTSYNLFLGSAPAAGGYFFDGILDEVSLYNRALVSEINDLYEAGAAGVRHPGNNKPPFVDAGRDQMVADAVQPIPLHGFVSDDGLPLPVVTRWSLFSGPGTATFSDANVLETQVTVSEPGTYLFKLLADDSVSTTSDLVQVRVDSDCQLAPPAGMAGWWPGNGNANDLIAGNRGELISGTRFGPGKVSAAFEFDGANDFVKVPKAAQLDVGTGSGMTLEFWIRPDVLNRWQPLVSWHSGTAWGAHLYIEYTYGGGRLYVNLLDTAGAGHAFYSAPGLVALGQFQHIGLTYDKSSGLCRFYRNGVLFQEVALGSFTPQTSYDLCFGHTPIPTEPYFDGALDEITLYNRALTTEFASIYQAGRGGKCAPAPNEAPYVDAGRDQPVAFPGSVDLAATVWDDGAPAGSSVTYQWSQVSGPDS
ncbi:MAG: LamG-like jellyroll fold domain-containing protein, partial [Verrucomicrobiota bacterium]